MNVPMVLGVAICLALVSFTDCQRRRCNGQYMCEKPNWYSKRTCIDKNKLCDESEDCPLSDDENDCPNVVATACPLLDRPTDGNIAYSGLEQGGVAEYYCNFGFVLSGNTTRTCLADKTWDGAEATCDATACSYLPTDDNGRFNLDILGFSIEALNAPTPVCSGVQTNDDDAASITFSTLSDGLGGQSVGTIATIACNNGYYTDKPCRVCQPDGTWTSRGTSCQDPD